MKEDAKSSGSKVVGSLNSFSLRTAFRVGLIKPPNQTSVPSDLDLNCIDLGQQPTDHARAIQRLSHIRSPELVKVPVLENIPIPVRPWCPAQESRLGRDRSHVFIGACEAKASARLQHNRYHPNQD